MGFERHNEFTVRFKFRVLETCSIGHSLPVSSSKHFWALQGIFFCEFCRKEKLEADGQRENQFYNRLFIFRCPKFAVGKLARSNSPNF
ncbi:MAG: hypothetical protein ACFNKL_01585, partial [Treponema sp.]